jgi:hypothetical protein
MSLIGGDDMEFTIKKILSIDKDAENLRRNSDALLESRKKELEEELMKMSDDLDNELLNEKKMIMDEKISNAKLKAEEIIKQKETEMNEIATKYNAIKSNLIQELFKELKNFIKEG